MSKEIYIPYGITGLTTLYAAIRRPSDGFRWYTVTPAWEAYASGHVATGYSIALTEEGTTGNYYANFPAGIVAAGRYEVTAYLQAGGSPAWPADAVVGTGDVLWSGSAVVVPGGPVASVTAPVILPAIPANWLTAAGIQADAVTKIQAGLSTYAGADTAGTTTILATLAAFSGLGVKATVGAGSTASSLILTAVGGYTLSATANAYTGSLVKVVAATVAGTVSTCGVAGNWTPGSSTLALSTPLPATPTTGDTVEIL